MMSIKILTLLFIELDTDNGVIVLTDLMGGTSFNRMMMKATIDSKLKVVAGINMPFVIEVLTNRSNLKDIDSFIKDTVTTSKESIIFGNELIAQ